MKYGNTLLGYFKENLAKQGYTIKHFNREFLAKFITEYNESVKSGIANYTNTHMTRFYLENSTGYCAFLELWNEYKNAINMIRG